VGQKIIVTNLHNRGMPFIRYEVGDLAKSLSDEPCACGRRSQRIGGLAGRDNDTIVLGPNRLINGEFFEFLFFGYRSVEQYQVVHFVKRNTIQVRIKLKDASEDIDTVVQSAMREKFGFDNVEVVHTNEFDTTPIGKLRFVYSVDD